MEDKRSAERFDVTKLMFVQKPEETRGGLLHDISATGARVEFVAPMTGVVHNFAAGDDVSLLIDDLGEVRATVVRPLEKSVALQFSLDDDEQQMLVADIKAAFEQTRDQ